MVGVVEGSGGAVPGEDAEWVAMGRRNLTAAVVGAVALMVFDGFAIRALVTGQSVGGGFGTFMLWGIVILLSGLLLFLPLALVAFAVDSRTALGVDQRGLWWRGRRDLVLLPWEELRGVRGLVLQHPGGGTTTYSYHLEIFPLRAADPAHRELWRWVREGEIPGAGEWGPHWRFSLSWFPNFRGSPRFPSAASRRFVEAVRIRRPELWLGMAERRGDRRWKEDGPIRRPSG